MWPYRRQPTRLPCLWDSPGKNTGVGCHFLLQWVKVKSLSCVWLLATPWTAAYQAPPSTGFSRQEYWSGVPLPSPQNLLQSHNLKISILWHPAFFMVLLSHLYMTTGKTIALIIRTFVGKMISLLFNALSRFVIAFLQRSKCLLILWLQSLSAVILETRKMKSIIVSTFPPSIYHEVLGQDAMIFIVWILSFKPAFSLFFTLIERLFSSSSLSAIKVLSSAYLRLLIFLPAILILALSHAALHFSWCTLHIS